MEARLLSVMFGVLLASALNAQATDTRTQRDSAYILERKPEFPGGEIAFYKYLIKELHYPRKARRQKAAGTVWVEFVVGQDGAVGDVRVARGVHPLLDAEVERVVKKMPAWQPGIQNNELRSVRYTIPVRFTPKGVEVKDE